MPRKKKIQISRPGTIGLIFLIMLLALYFYLARPIEYAQDVQVVDNLAYIATGLDGMRINDISDPENPVEVGYLDTPGRAKAIHVLGKRAYLASGSAGLIVLDISDPAKIRNLGSYNTAGDAQDVVVKDNRAYIADGRNGLVVLSVGDPKRISENQGMKLKMRATHLDIIGYTLFIVNNHNGFQTVDLSAGSAFQPLPLLDVKARINDISVQGGYAFLATTERGLVVVDISNPQALAEMAQYPLSGGILGVDVEGQMGYAVNASGLHILDFSHSPAIQEIGSQPTRGDANRIFVRDSTAYIADGYNGLVVLETKVLISPDENTARVSGQQIKVESLAKDANLVYLAASEEGVRILDTSDPQKPRLVSSLSTPGYVHAVAVSGDRAFIAGGNAGLLVADVSKPEDIGSAVSKGKIGEDTLDVTFANDLVYLADGQLGIKIVNFPQPLAPNLVGQLALPGSARGIAVVGSNLFAATGDGGFWIVNIANPVSPAILGGYKAPGGEARQVSILLTNSAADTNPAIDRYAAAWGEPPTRVYALLAYGLGGVHILDVTNPVNPQVVGVFQSGGSVEDVWVQRNRAYLANSNGSVHVLDIGNLSQPKQVGIFRTPGQAHGIVADGAQLFVANFERGLRVLDLSQENQPLEIGFYDAAAFVNYVTASGLDDNAYILDGRQGIWTVDAAGNGPLSEIGSYSTNGTAISATLADKFLYIADGLNGIQVLDASNPSRLAPVSVFDTPGEALEAVADRQYLFVADGTQGLRIYDQSNLTAIRQVSTFQTPGRARRIALANDYAFVACMEGGLAIVKIANPLQPEKVSIYSALQDVRDVWVEGNFAYLAAGNDGFRILDITHPLEPKEIFTNFAAAPAEDLMLVDKYVFIASNKQGVRIFDITDPFNPFEAGIFQNAKNALSLTAFWQDARPNQGRKGFYRVFVADGENRLIAFDAPKSTVITRSGLLQTPGTADLWQLADYMLAGLAGKPEERLPKAAWTIRQVRFDFLVLGLLSFLVWTAFISQYVLPTQGGSERYQVFMRLLLFLTGKHGMAIQIKDGQPIQHPNEENRKGFGVVRVDSNSAAILERRVIPYGFLMNLFLRFFHFLWGRLSGSNKQPIKKAAPALRIIGPGLEFSRAKLFFSLPRWDEKLHSVADLRPQVRRRDDVQGYTQDGIEISTSVSVVFSLGQKPDVLQVTYDGDELAENLRVISLEKKPLSTEESPSGRACIGQSVRTLRDNLDEADRSEIHLAFHKSPLEPLKRELGSPVNGDEVSPETIEPYKFFPDRVFAALVSRAQDLDAGDFMEWVDLPVHVAVDMFRNLLVKYMFDDLYKIEMPEVIPLQLLRDEFFSKMRNLGVLNYQVVMRKDRLPIQPGQIWDEEELDIYPERELQSPKILRRRGIKMIAANFAELKPDHKLVRQKLLDYWSSYWQKNTELLRADNDLRAANIAHRARIDAQLNVSYLLSNALTDAPEEALALRVLQALETAAADPLTRQFLPADTIQMLRQLYSIYFPGLNWTPGVGFSQLPGGDVPGGGPDEKK